MEQGNNNQPFGIRSMHCYQHFQSHVPLLCCRRDSSNSGKNYNTRLIFASMISMMFANPKKTSKKKLLYLRYLYSRNHILLIYVNCQTSIVK